MKGFITLIFFCLSTMAYAQECLILDKTTELPISNVKVKNEDGSKIMASDEDGKVDISDYKNLEILNLTHVGYVDFEMLKRSHLNDGLKIYLQPKTELLNEVFLSASKTEEKITRIAEQIAVVSSKDIEDISPQTSADMLAHIPGVRVQKTQFGGGSPVLRGMESNRVLLVVDGIRMNNAIYRKGHLQNAITVSPIGLDRTEVIFGPSSVIYGSDALGGVIHYYTRRPKTSKKNMVNTEFISRISSVNQEFTVQGGIELQMPKWASYTSVAHSKFGNLQMGERRSHGFTDWGKQFEYSNNTDYYYNPNPILNTNPSVQRHVGYEQIDILQKIMVPLSQTTIFNINVQMSNSTDINRYDKLTEYKGDELKFAEWYYGPQKRFLAAGQLELKPLKKWMNTGVVTTAFQRVEESRINRKFNSLDRSSNFEKVNIYSINGDFTANPTKSDNRNFGYGFEMSYNDVKSTSKGEILEVVGNEIIGISGNYDVPTRYPDAGSSYLSSALYMQYRQDIDDYSTLNMGVRLTNTILQAKWVDNNWIDFPDKDISLKNTAFTATVGYAFKPNSNWQINGVLSSGFRSPNIDDIGKIREKRGDVTVPNTNLKPEYAYNVEAGFLKYFNDKNFYVGLTAYYTFLNNYIQRSPYTINGHATIIYDGELANLVANTNMGNAYIVGATASLKGNLSNTFNTKGSLTYTKGVAYDTDEPLSSIPPILGNIELNYVKNRIETGFSFVFNGRKKLEDYNLTEGIDNIEETPYIADNQAYYGTPAWQILNYHARVKTTRNIDLLLNVNNIFDEHYKEFASAISAPGRNFSLTVIGKF